MLKYVKYDSIDIGTQLGYSENGKIKYAFYDFDGNGKDEMILGVNENQNLIFSNADGEN